MNQIIISNNSKIKPGNKKFTEIRKNAQQISTNSTFN